MNWKQFFSGMALICGIVLSAAETKAPSYEEFTSRIRPDHPRLFLTPEELPAFGERIRQNPMFQGIKEYVATLPENPSLSLKEDVAKWDGDKIIFLKKINDQNAVCYAFPYTGGNEAMCCTLMYFATGEERYRQMALRFLKVNLDFCALAERSKILPEWYNTGRLCAILAWDWLYNTMTPEQRQELMEPLLKHIEFMRKPGFGRNGGWPDTGFYGENALLWYSGVAAYGEKFSADLIEKHLQDGYKRSCQMMEFRDKCSGGTGVLSSITTDYSMGFYPYASFHFLMTLQSAAGLDMTKSWIHMRDFHTFCNWMLIPDPTEKTFGFRSFGWGDAGHAHGNRQGASKLLYNHMAQQIHLYGDSVAARKIIAALPEHFRTFSQRDHYPFLPFVLTRVQAQSDLKLDGAAETRTAQHFPSYGLTVMRSGTDPDDTYASFKGGAKLLNHQHYDENTFIIYRKGFLALDTGDRGKAKHHLLYYPQTIAHNGMLIRGHQEPVAEYWYPSNAPKITETVYMDGGQNARTVAKALPFITSDRYTICGGDATACYAKEKCQEAIRQFVYILPDYFVIYDRVTSVKPDQDKVFLLHTIEKPALQDGVWRSVGGNGALCTRMLLPKNHRAEIVGGKDNEFVAGGVNYPLSFQDRFGCAGKYRLEFTAPTETQSRFLTLMQGADPDQKTMVPCTLTQDQEYDTVSFTTREGLDCSVSFRRSGEPGGILKISGKGISAEEKRF